MPKSSERDTGQCFWVGMGAQRGSQDWARPRAAVADCAVPPRDGDPRPVPEAAGLHGYRDVQREGHAQAAGLGGGGGWGHGLKSCPDP